MALVADEGVESAHPGEIIDNVSHQLRLRAEKSQLTPIMFIASGINNFQHGLLLYNDDKPWYSAFALLLPASSKLSGIVLFNLNNFGATKYPRFR